MRKLIIPIPDLTHTEKTFLSSDYISGGGTTLSVINNYGFANDDIVIVGEPGEENTECKDVTSTSGSATINISAVLKRSHNTSCVVYRYEYDQYEIYRYRSAAWTLISTSNIQWDKHETIYVDTDGLSTDSYKYRLYNSASLAASDYSPTVAATGFTNKQVGYMIDHIRSITGDTERQIIKNDDELIRQLNRAQIIIKAIRDDWWFLRKENSQIKSLADTRRYGLNTYLSDMNYIDTVRYRYDDGTTDRIYHLEYVSLNDMDKLVEDNDESSSDWPEKYTIEPADTTDEKGYIAVDNPILTADRGTFYIRYFKEMADLETVADETDVPLPSILEDYAIAYVFRIKGDEERAKLYEDRFHGPQASKMEGMYNREPTGIRLLEIMQKSKGKPVGQSKYLKRPRNFGGESQNEDRDYKAEHYF